MIDRLTLIRATYWTGALVDAIVGIAMVYPPFFAAMEGFETFTPSSDYTFAMGMGAALMFGWTVLLIWADRKPVERRDVLMITLFPVLSGIYVNRIFGISTGFVTVSGSLVSLIVPILLASMLVVSYKFAGTLKYSPYE